MVDDEDVYDDWPDRKAESENVTLAFRPCGGITGKTLHSRALCDLPVE
jgi:hypothetical protein